MMTRSPKQIVEFGDTLAGITQQLESATPTVVMFVDLCGSTSLKARPQAEWLPIVCRFLLEVTKIVTREGGKVVKYIGDEVMAVFNDQDGLGSARAETCVMALDAMIRALGTPYAAKYVLDAGDIAEVTFPPYDVLGTAIDRCARIGKIAQPGVALASDSFRAKTPHKDAWLTVGSYKFKGLPAPVTVFRLATLHAPWKTPDPTLAVMTQEELILAIKELEDKVAQQEQEILSCRTELRRFRERL
jgi:class 3 adenylate cyclase